MREKQLPVNENVFNALLMGHSNAEDLESAIGIIGVMDRAGLEPSADTYTALLCGFARKGDIDSINKYINECEAKEISLLDKDYLEVVYALSVNGHNDKVDEVLSRLKKAFGYNQDAVNIILRLINRGQETTALKILKTMPRGSNQQGELMDTGNFLIKQLIKAKRPFEQVLSACNELEESSMNSKPLMIAVEAALSSGNAKLSQLLLRELQTRGLEVRQHYFWPVFCAAKSEEDLQETCQMMRHEFKISPSNQTIRDYIIPKILKNDNYHDVVQKLRNLQISTATAASTTAYVALRNFNIAKCAEILNSYDTYISPSLFRKSLVSAFARTNDYDSYVAILRRIHDNIHRRKGLNQSQRQETEEEDENETDEVPIASERPIKVLQADIIGDLVADVMFTVRTDPVEMMQNILQRLVDQGLSINNYKAERIQNKLAENMTAEISTLLGKLTSGELEPIEFEKQKMRSSNTTMDTEKIERLIQNLEEKGENTKGLKRMLLVSAIRSRNIEKSEEIIERLKAEGYILSSGVYAQLIELYASADKIEQALDAYKKIRETDPEFHLDEIKSVKVAQAFVNADRVEESIKFLEANKPKENLEDEKAFNYQSTCWRLLNSLADQGRAADLQKIFDALVSNGYIIPNNVLLGSLIKAHLVKDELKQAVDKFEEICQKYRATPWKNEIACRLIQAEDAPSLQRITDLSSEIHGEVNSLYDLVFSFIECGRIRQAKKILGTAGLRSRPTRINMACERYVNENMFAALEGLAEATKDLNHIDRSEIYYSLLQTYIKEAAVEKALNLWTTMQEENISPSDIFLVKLADFLKSHDQNVPFHVPTDFQYPIQTKKEQKTTSSKPEQKEPVTRKNQVDLTRNASAFKNALKSGNVDEIWNTVQALVPADKVSVTNRSVAIEKLLQNDQLTKATKLVFDLLDEKLVPIPKIFRFYLNKLASSADTETLEKIRSRLSAETKKLISFDNRMCHSYVAGGKTDEYLKKLEDAVDAAKTPEEIALLGKEFPRGGN